jgi:pimeloyl-ACP methyl ester carboxylesterase
MPYFTVQGGIRLYYEETGTGSPIVFVHEFAGDHRSYDQQVRHFSRRYRCVTYDARGYPPSDVPAAQEAYSQRHACNDLLTLLDHLHIDRAHLVGVSMGSFTVLFVALDAPDRVRSAVIAGCGFGADPAKREKIARDIDEAAEAIERGGMMSFAQTYGHGPARIQFKNKNRKGWQEMVDQLASHSAAGSAMTLRGVQKARPLLYDLRDRLARLRVPLLVVAGDEDESCLEASLYLKRTVPSAGLAFLPRTGHTVNLEEPARFNTLCEELFTLAETNANMLRDPLSRRENAFGRG